MVYEIGNVLLSFAKRRHDQFNYIQSVEKILAKAALGHFGFKVLVCSGDYPCVEAFGG
ncbi:hypothetical protein D3C83_170540 [compost metagenome]